MSVAAIGDPVFIAGFELVGAKGFKATSAKEVIDVLDELIKSGQYAVIILPERYVEDTAEVRAKVLKEGKAVPIFAFMPDYTEVTGRRIKELKRMISLAVGAELKL